MNGLVEEISHYIKDLFSAKLSPLFFYHNLQHTKDVVHIASKIADHYGLTRDEKELILISAWFHDTGYVNAIENHEVYSVIIAENYLKGKNYPEEKIGAVKKIILSTKLPREPQNFFEDIICDADIAYIGEKNLSEKINLLRREWESTINKSYSDYDWLKQNIEFLETNDFHTDYAKKVFSETRADNLANLRKSIEEIRNNLQPTDF